MTVSRFLFFCCLLCCAWARVARPHLATQPRQQTPSLTIAIQPLGYVAPATIAQVRRGIQATYKAEVMVLPGKSLPASTWYAPTSRYRAEKILQVVDREVHARFTKVLALTDSEISTTNGRHYDWSISGYGLMNQRPCVVSTSKIRRKNGSSSLFFGRLTKIANHELGHTLGLDHCSNSACLMAAMKGTLRGLDREAGTFCSPCRQKLKPHLRTG